MTSIDLRAVREKQLAFFLDRISGAKAEVEWQGQVAAALETWLETPLEQLTTPEALTRALEAGLSQESFARAIRPFTRSIHLSTARALRREEVEVGRYVPGSAREKIEALLARPNREAERLLRQVLAQDAMEETMRDVLYDALKEFNEKVNPFVAEWGLPGIMKKLGPFGFSPLAKSIEGVRRDFDKRLEPEMRKFLQGFARKALDKTGDLMQTSGGGVEWGELRGAVLEWIYQQKVSQLMADVDDEGASLMHAAVLDVAEHAFGLEDVKARARRAILELFARRGRDSLRDVLADHGAAAAVDASAIARATWPAVKALLTSEPVALQIRGWLDEFWDGFDPGE